MTSSPKRPVIETPEEPAPAPLPIIGREEEEAKKKVRRRARRTGRESTILANRMTQRSILNTTLAPG